MAENKSSVQLLVSPRDALFWVKINHVIIIHLFLIPLPSSFSSPLAPSFPSLHDIPPFHPAPLFLLLFLLRLISFLLSTCSSPWNAQFYLFVLHMLSSLFWMCSWISLLMWINSLGVTLQLMSTASSSTWTKSSSSSPFNLKGDKGESEWKWI